MIGKGHDHPRRTRIKICGIRTVNDAIAAVEAGADAVGLVFVENSPRCIRDFDVAVKILAALPAFVTPVGVFQLTHHTNATFKNWCECAEWCQFHGTEDEALLGQINRPPQRVIRGFKYDPQQIARWDACDSIDTLLIDGPAAGSGKTFNHQQLAALMPQISKPVILAGGLTPQNVGDAIGTVQPFGVDVSSGVESAPGVKEPGLIHEFCAAVREADGLDDTDSPW